MKILRDVSPVKGDGARVLLVMLPGAYMKPGDFSEYDFFRAVRRRTWPVDIAAVDTGTDGYLDDAIAERLHDEVIAPALTAGADRIWLAGISLGGMGALLYAQAHPETVEGLLLLSPFVGSRGLISEVEKAGGLRSWRPGKAPTTERRLLAWLAAYATQDPGWPEIRLAYGARDRFATAHRLLADVLPAEKVVTNDGGHDWPTWEALWERLLETSPFAAGSAAQTWR